MALKSGVFQLRYEEFGIKYHKRSNEECYHTRKGMTDESREILISEVRGETNRYLDKNLVGILKSY